MNTFILRCLAICIALGTAAFTTSKQTYSVYFTFSDAGSTASTVDVEDLTLWIEDEEHEDCVGDNQACQIKIDQELLIGVINTSRTLATAAPTLVIDAQDIDSDGKHQPLWVSGPSMEAINKP